MKTLRLFSLIIVLSSFSSAPVMCGLWEMLTKKKPTPVTTPTPVAKPTAVEKKSAKPNQALERKTPGCTERVLGMCKKKQVEEPKKSRFQRFRAGVQEQLQRARAAAPHPMQRARAIAHGIAKNRFARFIERRYNLFFDGFGDIFSEDLAKRNHARRLVAAKAMVCTVVGHEILSLLPDYVTWVAGGLAGLYIVGTSKTLEKLDDFLLVYNG